MGNINNSLVVCLLLITASMLFSHSPVEATPQQKQQLITFAMMGFSKVKEQIYRDQVDAFERKYPQYKVRMVKLVSRNYPDLLNEALSLKMKVDVINWFAGERLHSLIKDDMLTDIDEFWLENNLDAKFSGPTKVAAQYNGHVYGVPITSYVWGFYYKKALFDRLGLSPPKNWQEFILVLQRLKNERISPIALGSRYPWQIASWFDYLTLRLHGEHVYKDIVKGKLSFKSPEVIEVFNYWHELLAQEYVFPQHKFYDGEELMPLLYREVVGVNLIGTFVLSSLPENLQREFGYFPFPTIGNKQDNSVLAPLSLISVTKRGKSNPGVEKLVSFFSQEETQKALNKKFSTFSPISSLEPTDNNLMNMAYQTLSHADYQSQYFDIEMQFEMAEFAKAVFAEFINHRDIAKATDKLEQKRLKVFQNN